MWHRKNFALKKHHQISWETKSFFSVSAGSKELTVYFWFTMSFIQPLNVKRQGNSVMEVMPMLLLLDLMFFSQPWVFYFCVATVGAFTWVSMKRIGPFVFSKFINIEHWILPLVFVSGVWLWSWWVSSLFLSQTFLWTILESILGLNC